MKFRWTMMFFVSLGLATGACRSSGADPSARPERPKTAPKDPFLIEGDELKIEQARSLYEVIRIQRPAWLSRTVRNRQGQDATVVYLDERILGNLSILREIPPSAARSLQYLSPTEAQLRFGPNHGRVAAIVVSAVK